MLITKLRKSLALVLVFLMFFSIQAWLGHSTIGTTANIYTHLDENNKLSSANAILSILPEK